MAASLHVEPLFMYKHFSYLKQFDKLFSKTSHSRVFFLLGLSWIFICALSAQFLFFCFFILALERLKEMLRQRDSSTSDRAEASELQPGFTSSSEVSSPDHGNNVNTKFKLFYFLPL